MRSWMFTIAAILLSACFSPAFEQPRCGPNDSCPSGLTCSAGVCLRDPLADLDGPMADAPADSTFPSCRGLPRTCGPTFDGDCCASPLVPGGTYLRTYDVSMGTTGNTFPATVSDFRLDKYEVTVGRFRAFVQAGQGIRTSAPAAGSGAHARTPDSGWRSEWASFLPLTTDALTSMTSCNSTFSTWTSGPNVNDTRPINCVSWYVAMAFCIWDGGYLPTDAEWNYAAAGGDEHRIYPWSVPAAAAQLDNTRASFMTSAGECFGDGDPECAVTDQGRAGSKPMGEGKWGHSELVGNVYEWTFDLAGPAPVPCLDCAQLTGPPEIAIYRGASMIGSPAAVRIFVRPNGNKVGLAPDRGFRCARPAN